MNAISSHIRAGEIIAERTSTADLTYHFTLVLYTSNDGPTISPTASIKASDGWESAEVNFTSAINLGNDVTRMIFEFDRTFPGPNAYTITYQEFNRVGGIQNMTASGSSPFFLETFLLIDGFLGQNSSPELLVPPIDNGATNQIYNYNPGAFDIDGDSLAYKIIVPLQDSGLTVLDYVNPGDPLFSGGNNSFTLNPLNGNLVWDFPDVAGLYNVAFIVEEYRAGLRIGYVHRDMQINIIETENIKPELILPENKCYLANDTIIEYITAGDANGDDLELIAFGGVLNNTISLASFVQDSINPASATFTWAPACQDARDEPYQVIVKADDKPSHNPNPSLVDIEVWEMLIYGPPVQNLTSNPNPVQSSITLNWNSYECNFGGVLLEVWRKDCSDPTTIECDDYLGDYGYVKIDSIPASLTTYTDDDKGVGLKDGRSYCYRVVAKFPEPQGGVSIPSNETCEFNDTQRPYMLNVDVTETSTTDGEIFIRWTDRISGGNAPKFRLYRAEGETPPDTDYELVAGFTNSDDTSFTDVGLNTQDLQYSYKAKITGAEESNHASSVRLDALPESEKVELTWHADVPWSLSSGLMHDIYRFYESKGDTGYILIDQVEVLKDADMVYIDTGQYNNIALNDEDTVCYYVLTRGQYCNDQINNNEVLENRSQRICVVPQDTTPPCPPILAVEDRCIELENLLTWVEQLEPLPCFDDIDYYEIFRKPGGADTFELVGTTPDTSFLHENLDFITGCYKVRAVDLRGNVSIFSDSICIEDCPSFILPNIFTPNGDLQNALFKPIPPLRAVKNVKFTVYNRWGKRVYYYEGAPEINWNGSELKDGLYYYKAEIETYTLEEEEKFKNYKGWVQILR